MQIVTESWASDFVKVIRAHGLVLSGQIYNEGILGNINPGLFSYVASYPDRTTWMYENPKDSHVENVIKSINFSIRSLDKEIRNNGGRLVIFLCLLGLIFVQEFMIITAITDLI